MSLTRTRRTEKWRGRVFKRRKADLGRFKTWPYFWEPKVCGKNQIPILSEKPDADVRQKRRAVKDTNPEIFLRKGARLLKCDMQDFVDAGKVTGDDEIKRDLLLYYLWKSGRYNNQEIGR